MMVETIAISIVFHSQVGNAVVCSSPLMCSSVGSRVHSGEAFGWRQVRYSSGSGRKAVIAIQ
jgi:hypothetical protein